MTVRILLADDQPLVRAGLTMVVNDLPDLEVAGEAGTGTEAVHLAADLCPDVVVMDIRMPGMDGIEATRLITTAAPESRVVMLTTFDDDENVYGALRAGASGFLVKDMALSDIIAAIRVVAAGDALIAPSVTRRLIRDFAARPPGGASGHSEKAKVGLASRMGWGSGSSEGGGEDGSGYQGRLLEGVTDREREVLALVGRGMSNSEIAAHLFIGPATAKTHVSRLLTKLGARDRVHLVIAAYEAGMISPSN